MEFIYTLRNGGFRDIRVDDRPIKRSLNLEEGNELFVPG